MQAKNIILSTNHLDFINNIDNLIYDLLYSKERGYINLSTDNAIKEYENYIAKFNFEIQKIEKSIVANDKEKIIDYKRKDYIEKLQEHFNKETINKARNVFAQRMDNCIFQASLNKDNKEKTDELYSNGLCAISWIADILEYGEEEKEVLVDNFNLEFGLALNSKDENPYIEKNPQISNSKRYISLYELIAKDTDQFINLNLEDENVFLTAEDIQILKQKQEGLKTFKKTDILDENNLINHSIKILGLKKDDEKYRFLKEVEDDINFHLFVNKKIIEEDKIKILKRRIHLFREKDRNTYFNDRLLA